MGTRGSSPLKMFARALVRRCPRCGRGKLFRRYFSMAKQCPRCEYLFAREDGFALGASVVNLVFSQIVAIAYLIVSIAITLPDPPVGRLAIIGVVVAIGSAVLFMPFSKTIWAAIDLVMHSTMGSSYGTSNKQPGLSRPTGRPTSSGVSRATDGSVTSQANMSETDPVEPPSGGVANPAVSSDRPETTD